MLAAEAARQRESLPFNTLSIMHCVPLGSQSRASCVPLSLKRAASRAVSSAEGLQNTRHLLASQEISQGDSKLTQHRSRSTFSAPKAANEWCVDNSIQYLLHGRLDFKVVPKVTGLILDGSGYACKDYNHYGIMKPKSLRMTCLPMAVPSLFHAVVYLLLLPACYNFAVYMLLRPLKEIFRAPPLASLACLGLALFCHPPVML